MLVCRYARRRITSTATMSCGNGVLNFSSKFIVGVVEAGTSVKLLPPRWVRFNVVMTRPCDANWFIAHIPKINLPIVPIIITYF